MKTKASVIIPEDPKFRPEEHEMTAAWILAKHYNCRVSFLRPITGYKIKTADFVMKGVIWELKSPISNSRRRCVSDRLSKAKAQSHNIVFDGRRTKINDEFLQKQLLTELDKRSSINRLLFITKKLEVMSMKSDNVTLGGA